MMHRSLMRSGTVLSKRPSLAVRHFRKSSPTKYTENKELTGMAGILEADNHALSVKAMHLTSLGLMAAVPVAFVLSPSPLAFPVDMAMGVMLPVHAHIGMNNVISDYVPQSMRTLARLGWLGATSLMFVGLLRVNLEGPGITEVVKTIWRESPEKKKVKA
ncbi:protein [Plasmopara halstedii]|uniref:Succinate dehydrogenase [ubiquinone] cytochrome b small subunit n=1 Tax=Plasmopara halstedii TaxID=4781 RepID=A0A0P1AEG3_PLAHL|nr:protein [Plasmopara halstedii]CEG39294.1 protein [Plasmopara halstedii]|eukprot:XP_024575663.1 protein [Plasmopara halstedii]